MSGLEWMTSALCAQVDPEIFHPAEKMKLAPAKRTCARCEVRGQCLTFAMGNDPGAGVYGGLSAREREVLRREHSQDEQVAA